MELLAVAGDEQQCVVGACAQYQDRHDRARLAVDRHAQLGDPVADRAREGLREDHRRQRDEEEHRRAVDDDQQEDHQAERGQQQGPVDAFEDFDRVGREPGAAGDLHLQPAARVGDLVAPGLDRIDDQVTLAFGLDVGGDDRGLAVRRADGPDEGRVVGGLAGHRRARRAAAGRQALGRSRGVCLGAGVAAAERGCAVGHDPGEALRRHRFDVLDDRRVVGGVEARLAPVDDHRGREFALLQRFGRVEGVGRLGVARQVGGRLVAFGVFELAWQVGPEGDEDRQEPDRKDDPLRAAAGRESEQRASHWSCISIKVL